MGRQLFYHFLKVYFSVFMAIEVKKKQMKKQRLG